MSGEEVTALVAAPATAEEIVVAAPIKGRSLWDDARRRLKRNPAAMASLVVLCVLALLALLGPLLWVHKVDTIYRDRVAIAPTWENAHWFGTDAQGRDMVARVLFGLGISLMVGMVAVVLVIRPLVMLLDIAIRHNALIPGATSMIRWQSHWHVVRPNWSFFQNDFAGRIAQRVMQTANSLRESVMAGIRAVLRFVRRA